MAEISGAMQNRISPPVAQFQSMDFSSAEVDDQTAVKKGELKNRTDFRDLLANSNEEIQKEREAQRLGDLSADTEEEFFEKLLQQNKPTREAKKELGKDDFLHLFVAQLQNQDPLNPDDGTEMASKLAQFNGLEQQMNTNKTLEEMVKAQNVGRNLQMVNYVGKEIAIDGGRVRLADGKLSQADFELSMPVTKATLTVRDSSGMKIHESELGAMNKGSHSLNWNGKNDAGNTLADGVYSFNIYAHDSGGEKVPVDISSRTLISGVDVQSSNGALFTDLGKVNLEDIKSVGVSGYANIRPAIKAKQAMNDSQALEAFKERKELKEIAKSKAKEETEAKDASQAKEGVGPAASDATTAKDEKKETSSKKAAAKVNPTPENTLSKKEPDSSNAEKTTL